MVLKQIAHIKGAFFEKIAVLWLSCSGYTILRRNARFNGVEVDILAYKKTTLILVEVKFRQHQAAAHTAIHPQQQRRLMRQLHQLSEEHPQFMNVRLDVVLFFPHRPFIEHIRDVHFS